MNIKYEIGESIITEKNMHVICEEVIELLKTKKITYAVAQAILIETKSVLEKKFKELNLESFD